jgi:hypothetical protein
LHPDQSEKRTSKVTAIVGQYEEQIILCPPSADRRFATNLVIVAPAEREGCLLEIVSNKPLPPNHPFRQKGRRLTLVVQDIDAGRGTSLIPAEGITHILYTLGLNQVRSIAEEPPNQPLPEPSSGQAPGHGSP